MQHCIFKTTQAEKVLDFTMGNISSRRTFHQNIGESTNWKYLSQLFIYFRLIRKQL